MTAARERSFPSISVDDGVYAPQDDSFLLCAEIATHTAVAGARVLDLCTGSGIAAIEAARRGAREVVAYDISSRAVACALSNADVNGVSIDARVGTLFDAQQDAPFGVIVSNPPYVPSPRAPVGMGLHRAWDAGDRGRVVLDLLCKHAFDLLVPGGAVIMVQSELCGVEDSLDRLRDTGLDAEVIRRRTIDFGPVLRERAPWMEAVGLIEAGCRSEELIVIEGRRPADS
ncbi:HemK2/MTQ2 family protein methyltransferase [Rhodococcus sp. 1168]|uniref:HemK2/MTQ2 family protein methyltransferase n=1 Tax=Rhodococcus sp. 1168 TaxID=2018041 RepID=UPI0020CB08FB|nr:HemK2/MTQ2 family protein methyltransferase [Rhodococcus sp. 1168]